MNRRALLTRGATGAAALLAAQALPVFSALPVRAAGDQVPAADEAPALPPESPVLEQINAYRALAGAPPARIHPALAQSAQSHVDYYQLNLGDPSLNGMGLHEEKPGAAGFTGVTMGDRARAAGYAGGSVTENAGFGKLESALTWYMNTVNHRLPLIHPSATDMGFALTGDNGFGIFDVGLRRDKLAVDLPSVYPFDGAVDVPRTWDGAETPDPAPGVPRPLGYPITIAFGVYQRVDWQDFALLGPDGAVLPISTPKTDWMRAAAIIPHWPLLPGAPYTAHVSAVVDGKWVVKDWTFWTRG